jgi:thymidine phosphorylase
MDPAVFRILEKKRHGGRLGRDEIRQVTAGAASGEWGDAELGALLMACSIRGLDLGETLELTQAMLESGEQWDLAADLPTLGDKHSTGGVGDKVSLLLAPLMAAVGRPVMMLAGRGLGHTGGTTDKLGRFPASSCRSTGGAASKPCGKPAWRSARRPAASPRPTKGSTPCATAPPRST